MAKSKPVISEASALNQVPRKVSDGVTITEDLPVDAPEPLL